MGKKSHTNNHIKLLPVAQQVRSIGSTPTRGFPVRYDVEKLAYTATDAHRHGVTGGGEWRDADSMPFDRWGSDDNGFHHATGMEYVFRGDTYVEYVAPSGAPYLA